MRQLLIFFLLAIHISFCSSEVISIPNPNVGFFHSKEETQTIYRANENSKAVLIFLPGGVGSVGTEPNKKEIDRFYMLTSIAKGENSGDKFDFVFMDSPYVLSPMTSKNNLAMRATKDHIDRIKSVVSVFSEKTKKPIWLIGHSNGAYSLAAFLNQANENQQMIAGAIFSSGRNERSLSGNFNIPMLILHHENDSCPETLYSSAKSFYEHVLKQNKRVTEFVTMVGGTNFGEACFAGGSHHMFGGSYEQFNKAVLKFIFEN